MFMKKIIFFFLMFCLTEFCYPQNPCPGISTITYSGKTYNTVLIGKQCWLKQNLNVGTFINGKQNQSNNNIIEKYCYNNLTANCTTYGGLYQWAEAVQYKNGATNENSPNPPFAGHVQGICPAGWHIPDSTDFLILAAAVNNDGNSLKAVGQGTGQGAGTNLSGFSALLAGIRYSDTAGSFALLGLYTDFLTSSQVNDTNDFYLDLGTDSSFIFYGKNLKNDGRSIRCVNDTIDSPTPVGLTTFNAFALNNNVQLHWTTASEINSSFFEVQRKILNDSWLSIAIVKASGNSTAPINYIYVDKNISPGKYLYQLKIVDLDGSYQFSSVTASEVYPPDNFELAQNYPNPFNPSTTIRYNLPVNTMVTIKLFNALGKEILTLVSEEQPAGIHDIIYNGKDLSSGVYFYQMKAVNFIATKKLILMK
jgi:uncharacterized protein (TIGR02145 family)